MCSITRDHYGTAENRYLCAEGALGGCDVRGCEDAAIVNDDDGNRCALHVGDAR